MKEIVQKMTLKRETPGTFFYANPSGISTELRSIYVPKEQVEGEPLQEIEVVIRAPQQ